MSISHHEVREIEEKIIAIVQRAKKTTGVVERLEILRSGLPAANGNPRVEFAWNTLTDAIEEIDYLRKIFGAVQRGARPFKNFWDDFRRR